MSLKWSYNGLIHLAWIATKLESINESSLVKRALKYLFNKTARFLANFSAVLQKRWPSQDQDRMTESIAIAIFVQSVEKHFLRPLTIFYFLNLVYFFACNVHFSILRIDKQIKRTCWKQEKGNLRRT